MAHVGGRFFVAGHHRNPGLFRQNARGDFRAEASDRFRRWADEHHARILASRREIRVLAQKSVARMNRIRAVLPGRFEHPVDSQITFRRRRGTDVFRLICQPYVQRPAVGVREYGHARNIHVSQCPNDAHRDLAPVGDQNLLKHSSADCTRRRTAFDAAILRVVSETRYRPGAGRRGGVKPTERHNGAGS